MGLYDRDHTQEKDQSYSDYPPQMRMGLPSITPVVKWLLTINSAVYLINLLVSINLPVSPTTKIHLTILEKALILIPDTPAHILQIWRLITYQFLHASLGHIFFNMLGLVFFGPPIERFWGSKKFLVFYLGCGAAGGLFYILLVTTHFMSPIPMLGASGAILGVLTACAILFPQMVVFLFFFPLPIRVAAIVLILYSVFTLLSNGANAGGEACHLAGIAAGALYVLSDSWRTSLKLRIKSSRWEKRVESERRLRIELDRILRKVHESGLHSLTASEKRILKEATRLEQERLKY